MTTQTEALKLACQLLWRYRNETPIGNQPPMICQEVDEAFERIYEALAQPEQEHDDSAVHFAHCNIGENKGYCKYGDDDCPVITNLKAQIKEPEQEPDLSMREPSAIRDRLIRAGWTPPAQPEQEPVAKLKTSNVLLRCSHCGNSDNLNLQMEYTTPPTQCNCLQRQCNVKPLTDEQIEEIAARTLFPVSFARAIEAKLKEKNFATSEGFEENNT